MRRLLALLALVPLPALTQTLEIGAGPCPQCVSVPPTAICIVPCDTFCAGPAITVMGTTFSANAARAISQPATLFSMTGLQGWQPYAIEWLIGLEALTGAYETGLERQTEIQSVGMSSVVRTLQTGVGGQLLAEVENNLDDNYAGHAQSVSANTDTKESVAELLREEAEYRAEIEDLRHANGFYTDPTRDVPAARSINIFRQSAQLVRTLSDTPGYSETVITPNTAVNRNRRMALLLSPPSAVMDSGDTLNQTRRLAISELGAAFYANLNAYKAGYSGSSNDVAIAQKALNRLSMVETTSQIRAGSPKWLRQESTYLDTEAAALEARLNESIEARSLLRAMAHGSSAF